MRAFATIANRAARTLGKVLVSVGAVAIFVSGFGLTVQPATSGEITVCPAQDELRIVRDQIQRHNIVELHTAPTRELQRPRLPVRP